MSCDTDALWEFATITDPEAWLRNRGFTTLDIPIFLGSLFACKCAALAGSVALCTRVQPLAAFTRTSVGQRLVATTRHRYPGLYQKTCDAIEKAGEKAEATRWGKWLAARHAHSGQKVNFSVCAAEGAFLWKVLWPFWFPFQSFLLLRLYPVGMFREPFAGAPPRQRRTAIVQDLDDDNRTRAARVA
eukprot:TRINITY_DN48535_c0_g1_i1.p1 TRINITY_DN48535_c0_g1~~TRINITY_DN48535_c0_g1_i1.p1  ORF type:complete len:187 (+),score=12.32 TRINITY_DN48535_c0_g1_i1:58-618(+)